MSKREGDDPGLETLLEMDGEVFPMDSGYWTKIEARRVDPSPQIPHGIRYSLTLHDAHNGRVIGYDNAHGIKPKRKGYAGRRVAWDHRHDRETVENYEFSSAGQLMEDFWDDVNRTMGEKKGKR